MTQGQQGGQQGQPQQAGQQQAAGGGDQPRELGLDTLTDLMGMGPDMMLQILATVIDGIGVGMEWSGDQVARLGELAQQLSDKVASLGGGGEA